MSLKIFGDAVGATECGGDEIDGLLEAIIWFGTTEAEESTTGFTEAFTTEAGNAELVIGTFEEVEGETVAGDAELVADGGNIGEDVEGGRGVDGLEAVELVESIGEEDDFLAEELHGFVAFDGIAFEGGETGELDDGWGAGEGRIDHLADGVDDRGGGDSEAEPPTAHAVGFAEGVGGDALVHHAGEFEEGAMASLPDHVAVGFVAEDGDVLAADEVGEIAEVFFRGDATCGVVRAVEEDGLDAGVLAEDGFDFRDVGAEVVALFEGAEDDPAVAALDIGDVGGEIGAEDEDAIAGIDEGFAEELFEDFGTGTDDDVFAFGGDIEFAFDEGGCAVTESGKSGRGAIVGLIVLNGADAGVFGRGGAFEGAVTDFEFDDVFACGLEVFGDGEDGECSFDGELLGEITERDGHGEAPSRGGKAETDQVGCRIAYPGAGWFSKEF